MANVVFLWHMHQPYYVDPQTRTALMPWVRLHAVKGYLDMVSILEDFPGIRVNFNLTPVLVLQIKELIEGCIRDLWLEYTRKPAAELTEEERFSILENFFKINWDNLIKPFPRYWELLNKRGLSFYPDDVRRSLRYWSTQELLDLQVWFNLAWCGYTADKLFPELVAMRKKGRDFTETEKLRLIEIHFEILRIVLEKYAAAEERGQAELTTTPFFHPILPLVYDSGFATRNLPGRELPKRFHWPQDAEAQIMLAVKQHEEVFGRKPRGLWPSEGSIAPELIPLMQQAGIEYFCSDEENLFNSIKLDGQFHGKNLDHLELFQGWRVHHGDSAVNAVFREKPLSDFIGFMAARNSPAQAASHLLHHMEHIASMVPKDHGMIPLILDGENAWETFADGGESFLRALYTGIQSSPNLHSCTIEDYFRHHPPCRNLSTLHTGSWICSNFDIWIGDPEENRGWDLLGETRTFLQEQIDSGQLDDTTRDAALLEIYAAEGSDWFWWYGPDFQTECDTMFDNLFRQHLKNVYTLCGQVAPPELDRAIIGPQAGEAKFETPGQFIAPSIDGKLSSYFEWIGAARYEAGCEMGAMFRAERFVKQLFYGFSEDSLVLRIDLSKWAPVALKLTMLQPQRLEVSTDILSRNGPQSFTLNSPEGTAIRRTSLASREIIEWSLRFTDLGLEPGQPLAFKLGLLHEGIEKETYPEAAPFQLTVPTPEHDLAHWMV